MPRKNRRRRARRRTRFSGMRGLPPTIPAPRVSHLPFHLIECVPKSGPLEEKRGLERKESDDWIDTKEVKRKEEEKVIVPISFLKQLFPRDQLFTTFLSLNGIATTNSGGVLNLQLVTTSVASASEWSSINALFDEFFIHEMACHYKAVNKSGTAGVASAGNPFIVALSAAGQTQPMSIGLTATTLQGPPAFYTTASALCNNPNCSFFHSGSDWTKTWQNTVRFDPHGMTFSATTSSNGWQGWSYITDAAQYGGAIQVRNINDSPVGDGAHAVTVGVYVQRFKVSFRSRA